MLHVVEFARTFNTLVFEVKGQTSGQIDLRFAKSGQDVLNSVAKRIELDLMLVPNADELQEGDTLLTVPFYFGSERIPHAWFKVADHKLVQPSVESIRKAFDFPMF